MAWGYHTVLDAYDCNPFNIKNSELIKAFASELVSALNMKAYGEPMLFLFGEGDKYGYTLVQLIETSNITAHFAEQESAVFLDVFSCKFYDSTVVKTLVQKYFEPTKMDIKVLDRGTYF